MRRVAPCTVIWVVVAVTAGGSAVHADVHVVDDGAVEGFAAFWRGICVTCGRDVSVTGCDGCMPVAVYEGSIAITKDTVPFAVCKGSVLFTSAKYTMPLAVCKGCVPFTVCKGPVYGSAPLLAQQAHTQAAFRCGRLARLEELALLPPKPRGGADPGAADDAPSDLCAPCFSAAAFLSDSECVVRVVWVRAVCERAGVVGVGVAVRGVEGTVGEGAVVVGEGDVAGGDGGEWGVDASDDVDVAEDGGRGGEEGHEVVACGRRGEGRGAGERGRGGEV